METKNASKVIKTVHAEETPTDVAISWHFQNLFATYGEQRVRESMKVLFGMDSKKKDKKAS